MDKLTLEICKQFTSNPEINPLTGRKIKINGPVYLTIQEKCKELQQIEDLKHTIKTPTKINIANFKHVILYELDTLRKDELNKNFHNQIENLVFLCHITQNLFVYHNWCM